MPFIVGMFFDDDESKNMMRIDEYYSIFSRQGLDVRIIYIKSSWQKNNEFNFPGGVDEVSWAINFTLNSSIGSINDDFALIDTRLPLDISELLAAIRVLPNQTTGKGFILGLKRLREGIVS